MRIGACATVAIALACATARAEDEKVKVEVRGDANASLEQATIEQFPEIAWKTLCTTPCTVRVPGDATVRVVGAGFPSEPLKLEQRDTILVARVPPASNAETSSTLVAFGGVFLTASAITLALGVGFEISDGLQFCFSFDPTQCKPVDRTPADALVVAGIASGAVGAVMLGIGLSLHESARAKLSVSSRGVALKLAF